MRIYRSIVDSLAERKLDYARDLVNQIMEQKIANQLVTESQRIAEGVLREDTVEESMSTKEVQRIYDDIGDVRETEVMCGIRNLRVDTQGNVISFIRLMNEEKK